MWIKTTIVILLIMLLISLASGFLFLIQDEGRTKRTLHSLGVRVTLAVVLLAVIVYGFCSGQLQSKAPWDAAMRQQRGSPQPPAPAR